MSKNHLLSIKQPSQHVSYYFSNPVVFQVEDQLFRVPAYMFESTSPVFRDMFSLDPGQGQEVEGQTDAKPIRLEQVSIVDFEHLLKFFYPLEPSPEFDLEEWDSIFGLADRWQMADVRLRAIKILDRYGISSHPDLQIHYGKKYGHDPWVYKGLTTILIRIEGLTEKEGETLGIRDTVRCGRAREMYLNPPSKYVKTGFGGKKIDQDGILKEVFGIDIIIPNVIKKFSVIIPQV